MVVKGEYTIPEGFNRVDSLHLSLSRTLYVKEMHKELLLKQLETALSGVELPTTKISFSKLAKYSNDEGTCHFLALDLAEGESAGQLEKVIQLIDSVLKGFGLPQYYDPPSLHVSLGWRVDDWSLSTFYFEFSLNAVFDEILMKCGNKIHKLR